MQTMPARDFDEPVVDARNSYVGKSISINPSFSWILKVFSIGLQVGE